MNSIVVTITYAIPSCFSQLVCIYYIGPLHCHWSGEHTRFATQPIAIGSLKGRSPSILRPRRQFIKIGMAYEIPRATTEAERMALNALLEPRKIQPNITSRTTVNISALRGSCNLGWTLAKNLENGRPPSLHYISPVMRLTQGSRELEYEPSKSPRHTT